MSQELPNKKQKTTSRAMTDAEAANAPLVEITRWKKELQPLPFVHRYQNGKFFFVRDCYDEYYTLVKEMLDAGRKCVTVTGTPGIGKSVFYAYFFERFREEAKDTWIIAISYKKGYIVQATVFADDGKSEELLFPSETTVDSAAIRAHTQKKKMLFLCDGPPNRIRGSGGSQTVVFTSPNEEWLKSVRKDNCTLYMPLWTCEELKAAAEELGLSESSGVNCISDDVIEDRSYIFGGVTLGNPRRETETIAYQGD